ncbi:DUF4249 domain-containing protein [Flammeovirga sp. EKP202]|uniref:DUF4249 domain-containing protein n=1 Tax=Flammeovirga sp. EKP202 TaxID=2770592 RepID=UPI00165FCC9D|nr:DUF4249 domain-containing protein [Flammeovirga sp. EKP202]MBD0401617.1 DUF4249 domain-containing protein [Flammeovirga sp. EKP202]
MRSIQFILAVITVAFLVTACEKVIDVDLKDATPKIVIEAVLMKGENVFEVKISKTAPYFDNSPSEKIDNADVTLTYLDRSVTIPNTGNGSYTLPINAIINTEYHLEVNVEDEVYNASTTMLDKVLIDSIYSEYEEGFGPRESGYYVYVKYTDPGDIENFYRLTHDVNGEYQNTEDDLRVFNDVRNNGNQPRVSLGFKVFEEGDVVDVKLIHFDEASYDYFSSLNDIIGGSGGGPSGGAAAPGNPLSNWSNDALGYFSAYNYDSASIIIGQ